MPAPKPPATLSEQLAALEAADLIRHADVQPELEYFFRHALVQDATYGSLLRNNRRELHLAVARVLEGQGAEWAAEHAAVLAHHFLQGGKDDSALSYLERAGDAAAQKHANAEAILHYTGALEVALRSGAASAARAGELFVRRGRVFELSGKYDEALANYVRMADRARASGDRTSELSAQLSSATLFAVPNPVYDPSRAEVLALQVVTDARALGAQAIECRALWILMILGIYGSREPQAGVEYGLQSLALARSLGLREQLAYVLTDLYLAYFAAGKRSEAMPALVEARALWSELHNLPMLADSLARMSHYYFCAGDFATCIATSQAALQVSRDAHNRWQEANSQQIAASAYLEQGRVGEALEILRRMIVAADEGGVVPAQVGGRAVLGFTLAWLGDVAGGVALVEAAIRSAVHVPPMRAWAVSALVRLKLIESGLAAADTLAVELASGYAYLRRGLNVLVPAWVDIAIAMAELSLAHEHYGQVIALMDELCASLGSLGVSPFVYEAMYLKALALQGSDRIHEAVATLCDARAAADAIGARRALWHIDAGLGAALCKLGKPEEGRAHFEAARAHIEFIAAGLTADAMRQSFRQTAAVRAVLDRA